MKKIFTIFKLPTAEQAARNQLTTAKRDLLMIESGLDEALLKAEFQRGLIKRLTNQINSGELGELV